MSGHQIEWAFDCDTVVGRVICEEPEGANCRLTGGPECYCEDYHIERDPDGTPFHVYEGERHSNIPMDGCNIAMFLEAGLGYAYDKALHDVGVAHTPEGCSVCQGAES